MELTVECRRILMHPHARRIVYTILLAVLQALPVKLSVTRWIILKSVTKISLKVVPPSLKIKIVR